MGPDLKKQFFVVGGFYDPSQLPKTKLESNAWEQALTATGDYRELRPINVDPGYLTLTKLVLASAKDRAHRIYMSDGIYEEECLYYLNHGWQSRPWTYPDYQRYDFQLFFTETRELLKREIAQAERQPEAHAGDVSGGHNAVVECSQALKELRHSSRGPSGEIV